MFHQLEANSICQNIGAIKHGGIHRDPRCSLACRDNWAKQESALLIQQLNSIKNNHNIYSGNIQLNGQLTIQEHLRVRRSFLHLLREWRKQYHMQIEFRACSEIGRDGRIHYHYAMYANCNITQDSIKSIWDASCQPYQTIVYHQPARNIEAVSKYMYKDIKAVKQRKQWVYLFDYKTINITWQSQGFFQPNKAAVLKEIIEQRKRWAG